MVVHCTVYIICRASSSLVCEASLCLELEPMCQCPIRIYHWRRWVSCRGVCLLQRFVLAREGVCLFRNGCANCWLLCLFLQAMAKEHAVCLPEGLAHSQAEYLLYACRNDPPVCLSLCMPAWRPVLLCG